MKKPKPINLMRGLRRIQSDAEGKLWLYLRNRLTEGVKFRRQQFLGNYIVDFVSFEVKIIIEVDGSQHSELPNIQKDNIRTKWLENQGYQVIRFWNTDVLENIEGVMFKVSEALDNRLHPHLTSPVKGEELSSGRFLKKIF
jgi:very-short-patch-repair endonuclease